LSIASHQVLANFAGPLEVAAYAREQGELRESIKPDIVLHFVNPDAVPDEVRKLGVEIPGEMMIHYQGRSEQSRPFLDQGFTNALQRLLRGSDRWLAFIEGHEERSPLTKANHDINRRAQQLSSRGFKLQPINLAKIAIIPDNTRVLVIVSLQAFFPAEEVEFVTNFLAHVENLLWPKGPGDMHGFEALASYLSIEFPEGRIIDKSWQLNGANEPSITMLYEQLYAAHPVLANFN